MAKQNREFKSNGYEDDWGEYKKNSKKKMKHRDESNSWRFDKRKDYSVEDEYDDYDNHRKTGDW